MKDGSVYIAEINVAQNLRETDCKCTAFTLCQYDVILCMGFDVIMMDHYYWNP